jgi:hypothetical protein
LTLKKGSDEELVEMSYRDALNPIRTKKQKRIWNLFSALIFIGLFFIVFLALFVSMGAALAAAIVLGVFISLIMLGGVISGRIRYSAFQMTHYLYAGKQLRVLVKYGNEILFNTKDMFSLIGLEKTSKDPPCLNLKSAIEFANIHNSDLAKWLYDSFVLFKFKSQTLMNSKLDGDWTNFSDKRVWEP